MWTAPHIHVVPGEFVGKFGVYKNDRATNALREESWQPTEVEQAKIQVGGVEVATISHKQAKGMKATPPTKTKKKRL